jgi:hypothetical protein
VTFPTDARLFNREILARLAKRNGLTLRQSYARVGKLALIKHQRYRMMCSTPALVSVVIAWSMLPTTLATKV